MIKKFENLNFLLDFNIASFAVKIFLPIGQEFNCLGTNYPVTQLPNHS
jgi:hypothetical protein